MFRNDTPLFPRILRFFADQFSHMVKFIRSVVLSVGWIATICSTSRVPAAIASSDVTDTISDETMGHGSNPTIGVTTPVPVCTVGELSRGFYFGELEPIAFLELNVYSDKFLSMAFFFGFDGSRMMFRASALEYKFDPSNCQLIFVSGSVDVRFFGEHTKTLSEPKEIAAVLSEIIPPDAPVDLSQELTGTVQKDGIMVMGAFWLQRKDSRQDWLPMMDQNCEDEDWSMNPEDHSFVTSIAMMARGSSSVPVINAVIFFAVISLSL